jgi:CopA family copper-resistance protein
MSGRSKRDLELALSRRGLLQSAGALGLLSLLPSYARAAAGAPGGLFGEKVGSSRIFELEIGETELQLAGRRASAVTINGTVPAPLLHFREGEETVLRVTNRLAEDSSIHWHGLLVPPEMDGVPGLSFEGIHPGQTFEYRFVLKQYGTYWYHSHSALQEQLGHYGPMLIHPAEDRYPYAFEREHVIVLSDWTFANPYQILDRLKKQPGYYNFQKRTLADFARDVGQQGLWSTLRDRAQWSGMRMDPTDISDVTGSTYTFLMNGLAPAENWTGLFQSGERVLLHVINASSATHFDLRIPGLPMRVVQAHGQYVQPVETDELRIGIAETFDVIVQPSDRPYTVFAEAMDRSGAAAGTLSPREGEQAEIPSRRRRPVLGMADMGMMHHGEHGDMPQAPAAPAQDMSGHDMSGHDMSGHDMGGHGRGADAATVAQAGAVRTEGLRAPGTLPGMVSHERDRHGPGNAMVPEMVQSRLTEPGLGLGQDGWRVLTYAQLRALQRRPNFRAPTREIEMHLTGNMERFQWSIDGVSFEKSEPIVLDYDERIRLVMVNDTMMHHPMHLHGMWMELENGHGELIPRVHTVLVKPAERVSVLITADAPGRWAFHCHVLYHMEVGMFRVFEVGQPGIPRTAAVGHDH